MIFQHFKSIPLLDGTIRITDKYDQFLGELMPDWDEIKCNQFLQTLHNSYEMGMLKGRREARQEIRKKLGL